MTNPGPASEPPSTRTLLLVVMLASGGAELLSLAAVVRLAVLWLNGRLADQRRVAVASP